MIPIINIKMIIKEYKQLWPEQKIYDKSTPIADELQHESEVTKPLQREQKMIGMLLWVSRCSRLDIALAVSRLGSRVARWDSKCDIQLAHLIGYLQAHSDHCLTMKLNKNDKTTDLEAKIFTDANLANSGKSQSGYLMAVTGKHGTHVPVAWSSKKQPITADSTPMAELIATHLGVRETMCLASALQMDMKASDNVFTDDEQVENVTPVPVFNDNMEVVRNASKGVSNTLGVTAKALRVI